MRWQRPQRARQAAEVLSNEQSGLATRNSAKVVALEQELLAARREIDTLKGSAQKPAADVRRGSACVGSGRTQQHLLCCKQHFF